MAPVRRLTHALSTLFASRGLPLVAAVIALGVAWLLWRDLLTARRPTLEPLSTVQRRYGPQHDSAAVAPFRQVLPDGTQLRGTLEDAFDALSARIPREHWFVVNWRPIRAAGMSGDTPVDVQAGGLAIDDALERILAAADGGTRLLGMKLDQDGVLVIDTRENLGVAEHTHAYDLRDLTGATAGATAAEQAAAEKALVERIVATIDPPSWARGAPAPARGTAAAGAAACASCGAR